MWQNQWLKLGRNIKQSKLQSALKVKSPLKVVKLKPDSLPPNGRVSTITQEGSVNFMSLSVGERSEENLSYEGSTCVAALRKYLLT